MPPTNSSSRTVHRLILSAVLALACGSESGKTQASGDAKAAGGGPGSDAPAALPPAEKILAKAVTAIGGKSKLEAVESFYYEGQLVVAGQNIQGDLAFWWEDGGFYSESMMLGVGRIRTGRPKGGAIWSEDPINGLRELEGKEAVQAQWQASLSLIAVWDDHFDSAKTTGKRDIDGRTAYDVTLVSGQGGDVLMTFDDETGLQVAQKFDHVTNMGTMPVSVRIEDYRDVGGIQWPHRQVTDASIIKMTQQITKIELNVEVDDSRFGKPTKGGKVVSIPANADDSKTPDPATKANEKDRPPAGRAAQ